MWLNKITQIKNCVIGIDPGRTIGLALCINNTPIVGRIARTTFDSIDFIDEVIRAFQRSYNVTCIINVGAGGIIYRNRILYSLKRRGLIDYVRIVKENKTTPHNHSLPSKMKHVHAASLIAQRHGRKVNEADFVINFRKTDLREIQIFSRIISGNITISLQLAKRVALDEISIYDAIEQVQRKKNHIL